MNQFIFDGKQKRTFFIMMAIGVVSMIAVFFMDDELHTRFWTNFLHNSVFFTGISLLSLFTLAAFTTILSGWHTVLKRVWEAYSLFLIVGLVLMLIIAAGLWGHFHHLYHWADAEAVANDEVLQGKSSFLNKGWYTFGTLIIVGIWIFFALKLRKFSLAIDHVDKNDYSLYNKMKYYAGVFLPIAAFSSAAMIWQWLMSIDAHWFSTMYAWYGASSFFVASVALILLTVYYLKGKGYLPHVNDEHIHGIGIMMFAFSIFWTYLWYSQYMLIWYGNMGEETTYFWERAHHYRFLFRLILVLNFVVPFFALMRNSAKRKKMTMIIVAVLLVIGHWLDFFLMIKPGALTTARHALGHHAEEAAAQTSDFVMGFTVPCLPEIGTFIGFLGLFLFVVFRQLAKAPLEPVNDPYLDESVHYHLY